MVAPLFAGLALLGALGGGQFGKNRLDEYEDNRARDERRDFLNENFGSGLLGPANQPGLGQQPGQDLAGFGFSDETTNQYINNQLGPTQQQLIGNDLNARTADRSDVQLGLNVDAGVRADEAAALALRKQVFTEATAQSAIDRQRVVDDLAFGAGGQELSYNNPIVFDQAMTESTGRKPEAGFEWSRRTFNGEVVQAELPGTKGHDVIRQDGDRLNRMAASINMVDSILARTGTEFYGAQAGTLANIANDLLLEMKDVTGSGALDVGAITVLSELVPNFSDAGNQFSTTAAGKWATFKRSIAARQGAYQQTNAAVRSLPELTPFSSGDLRQGEEEVN